MSPSFKFYKLMKENLTKPDGKLTDQPNSFHRAMRMENTPMPFFRRTWLILTAFRLPKVTPMPWEIRGGGHYRKELHPRALRQVADAGRDADKNGVK